jgi:CubicO group peptidase (beta-lactamase class C family)
MTPSRATASQCAICFATIPGCRVTIGFVCPAICYPPKCWRRCAIEPSDDIRNTFQYSNLGYLVASMVAERVSGQSWAEFTRALTDRLHMEVTFTLEELAAAADAAVPYTMEGDTRLRSNLWPVSATAAGGMSTSIASFANWLRFHLGKGEFEGQRLLSPGLIQEPQKPRVHVDAPEFAEYSDVH